MSDCVIRAAGLVKNYGSHPALAGLDLEVDRGEVFGFIGPNGAGKTTTIRILLDLVRPTAGLVEVLGVAPRDGGAALRRRIAYLPGDLRLHDHGSVRDVVRTFTDLRTADRAGRAAMTGRADAVAARLDLALDRSVRSLSKGNRQKVGIVLALMSVADLLVLDEPTSGLDPLVQQEFLSLVREERAAGRTVFMSSHVLSEVEEVADRVGIIRDGVMVDVDDMAALRRRAARLVELRLADPSAAARLAAELAALPGVTGLVVEAGTLRCNVSAGDGDGVAGGMSAVVRAAAGFEVVDLLSHAPDLEELFLTYYGPATGASAGAGSPSVLQEAHDAR
ncbi:MAG: ABC transporter ATP-binding protein [Kineosporiaceae bacterium]